MDSTPISLRSTVAARPEEDKLIATGQVILELAKKATPLNVRLSIELRALDEQGHMKDPVALRLKSGPALTTNDGALIGEFLLNEDSKLTFDVESEAYDKEWTVTFLPIVKPVESEGEE